MTLVEVLIALGIFVVILGIMAPALLSTSANNSRTELIGTAVRIATDTLEDYRSKLGTVTVPTTGTLATTVTSRGQAFQVATTFCPGDAPSSMVCSGSARYIRVVVSRQSIKLYTAETFLTQLN